MKRGRRLILRGGDIVTPDRVVTDGALVIEDGLTLCEGREVFAAGYS